jgi:transcriptional regulator GlxA family with amidase domain
LINIGVYIYENAEILDFSGPYQVFSTASRFLKKKEKINIFLVSEENKVIKARGGFNIFANYSFADCPNIDVLIISGGVHKNEMKKKNVLNWIKEKSSKALITSSVCTGAFLLAKAKVIKKQDVTTHWEDIKDLRESFPKLNVLKNRRWVEDENIITSGGISAGIDMSLYLVSKLYDEQLAITTAEQMEFIWTLDK